MKILVVARGYPKPENRMLGLFEGDQACALKDAGHEVAYAVLDMRSIRHKRRLGYHRFIENGMPVYEIGIPFGNIPLLIKKYVEKYAMMFLYKKIQAEFGKPDIVHSHFYRISVGVEAFFHKTGIPVVFTEHSSEIAQRKLSKINRNIVYNAYRRAARVIAVSQPLSAYISEGAGIRVSVVPNIVGFQAKAGTASRINSEEFRFVSAGNLVSGKRFDLLIDAMAKIVEKHPQARLTIYGDGPERTVLEKKIVEKGLAKKVCLYGRYFREQLLDMYDAADAFVLASQGETFGVVYIEAMAAGLPVIATICGGPEDIVNDKVGVLIEKENLCQLVAAMEWMIENIGNYNRDEIRRYAVSKFSPEQVAAKLTEVFQDVLKNRSMVSSK